MTTSTHAAMEFTTTLSSNVVAEARREELLADPGFGTVFTDHMLTATWTPEQGWHDAGVRPYTPFQLDPATAVLHYAQEIFEGLKAYRHDDGSIWTLRPEANAARFARSAHRLALPPLNEDDFIRSIDLLVQTDHRWVPSSHGEASLYVRPFMFASETFLGVRPAHHVTYCVITSPAGAYFPGGVEPVDIWLSTEFTRAAPGGTGAAKFGGNYAASLLPQQQAAANGCQQVCFVDGAEHRWVEELGGMNLYFVQADGSIVTPRLGGTILEGVTRDSIVTLARDRGREVVERPVSIDEWRDGVASGQITEVFACGTAAVITPLGTLKWDNGSLAMPPLESAASFAGGSGSVALELRQALLDLQYGRAEDRYGWMHRVL